MTESSVNLAPTWSRQLESGINVAQALKAYKSSLSVGVRGAGACGALEIRRLLPSLEGAKKEGKIECDAAYRGVGINQINRSEAIRRRPVDDPLLVSWSYSAYIHTNNYQSARNQCEETKQNKNAASFQTRRIRYDRI